VASNSSRMPATVSTINQQPQSLCNLLGNTCADLTSGAGYTVSGGCASTSLATIRNDVSCPEVSASPPPGVVASPPPPKPPSTPPPPVAADQPLFVQWVVQPEPGTSVPYPSPTSAFAIAAAAAMQAELSQQPGMGSVTVTPINTVVTVSSALSPDLNVNV
jgi:hypothetical protein